MIETEKILFLVKLERDKEKAFSDKIPDAPALSEIVSQLNPHCAESPILAMKKNIFDKFQPILG